MNKTKKLLVTFDLNCLLGYVQPVRNFMKENALIQDYKPHKVEENFNIWLRPNVDQLYNKLFYELRSIFEVGIWASQTKENSAFQINKLMGSLKYNLKFAMFTKPPSDHKDNLLPFPFKRDLKIIFERHTQFDEKNTIVISNYKNEMSEYRDNEVIMPLYHPLDGETKFEMDAHMYFLMEYLVMLHSIRTKNKSNFYTEIR